MIKNKKIILIILGIFIVLIIGMLSISPMMKENIKEKEIALEKRKQEELDAVSLADNVAKITLGTNTLIDGDGVTLKGADVYINKSGTYDIKGKLVGGSIHVDTTGIVILNLNNIDIETNKEAIVIDNAYQVNINLEKGSTNYISDGIDNPYIAAISSNCPLVIEGEGSLFIDAAEAPINSQDGYVINAGKILALGKDQMFLPKKKSAQTVYSFNFNDTFNKGNVVISDGKTEYIKFENSKEWNSIMICGLQVGKSYSIYQNFIKNPDGTYSGLIKDSIIIE